MRVPVMQHGPGAWHGVELARSCRDRHLRLKYRV